MTEQRKKKDSMKRFREELNKELVNSIIASRGIEVTSIQQVSITNGDCLPSGAKTNLLANPWEENSERCFYIRGNEEQKTIFVSAYGKIFKVSCFCRCAEMQKVS